MPIKYLYNSIGPRLTSSQKGTALFFLIAVAGAYFFGDAIVNDHNRRLASGMILIISLPFIIWILNKNSQRRLFTVFMMAIAFSSFAYQIALLPRIQLTLSGVVILAIFCIHLLLRYNNRLLFYYTKKEIVLISFFLIYIFGGFLNILFTGVGGMHPWINTCVVPFIIVYVSFSLISNLKQVRIVIIFGFLSLVVCLIFSIIMLNLGYGGQIDTQVRTGQLAVRVSAAGLNFALWATHVGAMAAMALPLVLVFSLYNKSIKERLLFTLASMLALYIGYQAGTRGFAIATVASMSIIIMLLFLHMKKNKLRLINGIIRYVFIVCIILVFFELSVSMGVQKKFYELYDAGYRGFAFRIDLISDAYGSLLDNPPIGVGFNTLFRRYGTDEATFYSWSANGVGLIGVIGFWGIIATLLIQFIKGLYDRNIEVGIFSIIGIGTIISTLVSALSSQSLLVLPHSVLPFWAVMGAVFKSTYLDNDKSNAIA